MAADTGSLQPNPTLHSLGTTIDPKSLILSQFSDPHKPNNNNNLLQLTTDTFFMERGPRYKAYADLRESKLRLKNPMQLYDSNLTTPPNKQVKFQEPPNRRKPSSVLAQSVPDFSVALRKENRKPALPPLMEKSATPPPPGSKNSKLYGVPARLRGSKSANSGDKRSGGLMARKSYASVEELKGLSSAAATAINAENRGGRSAKTVLGYRQY